MRAPPLLTRTPAAASVAAPPPPSFFLLQNATQWKNLLITLIEMNVILLILHKMNLPNDGHWYEDLLDNLSIQGVLYHAPETSSEVAKTRAHADFFASIEKK